MNRQLNALKRAEVPPKTPLPTKKRHVDSNATASRVQTSGNNGLLHKQMAEVNVIASPKSRNSPTPRNLNKNLHNLESRGVLRDKRQTLSRIQEEINIDLVDDDMEDSVSNDDQDENEDNNDDIAEDDENEISTNLMEFIISEIKTRSSIWDSGIAHVDRAKQREINWQAILKNVQGN